MNGKIQRKDPNVVSDESKPEHIAFSFEYLVSNKEYGIDGFDSNEIRKSIGLYKSLFEKMYELSQIDMVTAKGNRKISGYETIPLSNFNNRIRRILKSISIISTDAVLYVFRFNQNNGRMICKTDPKQRNLVYVLAFDLDFSAYPHG